MPLPIRSFFTRRGLTLALLTGVLLSTTSAQAEDYLFFRMLEVERSGKQSRVLFPHIIHFDSALAQRDLIPGIVGEMEKGREDMYSQLAVAWLGEGKVEVRFKQTPTPDLFPALAELFYSMRFNGIKDLTFLDPNGGRVDWGVHPFPAFLPVVSYLGTLDPIPFPETVVALGEDKWVSGDAFEKKQRKSPSEMKRIFGDALAKEHALVKLYLLDRLDNVPLANVEASLIKLLADSNPGVRMKAIDYLRDRKSSRVIAALEKVVDVDDNADVKTQAVLVLDGFGIKKYRIFILFSKLKSGNEAEVRDAMEQLIASGNPKVVVGLASVLSHHSEGIRQLAVEGIRGFDDTKVMAASLEKNEIPTDVKEPFAMALVNSKFRDLRAKGYAWVLKEGAEERKVEAMETIASSREAALVPAVVSALDDSSENVVRQAAATLAALKVTSALDKLAATAEARPDLAGDIEQAVMTIVGGMRLNEVISLAKSDTFTLRKFATKSLAEFTKSGKKIHPKVRAILLERMTDENIEIKRAAVYALARAQDKDIVAKLVKLADDKDNEIREQVMVSLNKYPVAGADKIFLAKLDDPYDPVRLQAIKGIRQLKVTGAVKKLTWLRSTPKVALRREVISAIAELMSLDEQKRNFDLFSEALYDMEPSIKLVAMGVLSKIKGDPRVAPTLSALVLDPDASIKQKALNALAETGDPAAVEYVVQGLFDTDDDVKKAALGALKKLHHSAAEKPLQEFIKNESAPQLRQIAEDVLYSLE